MTTAPPPEIKPGDPITAALFNLMLKILAEKLDKTDPKVPVYDPLLRAYLIGTGE